MRRFVVVLGLVSLAGCGASSDNAGSNAAEANAAAAQKPKPAYCFFKDSETKDWKATLDKDGNVVVTGKAYREDSRYKVILSPATVSGATAEVAPTIAQNDTGYGAPDNWWSVSQTLADSQAVDTVVVKCGDETLATIKLARKK
ncbi:MAG TPA: hypothetical protein VE820_13525 [Sphingomicrobium sp.]|jgi:hypothetical protein|nr:hypothetical protein [Sphingomicrobium sp.]